MLDQRLCYNIFDFSFIARITSFFIVTTNKTKANKGKMRVYQSSLSMRQFAPRRTLDVLLRPFLPPPPSPSRSLWGNIIELLEVIFCPIFTKIPHWNIPFNEYFNYSFRYVSFIDGVEGWKGGRGSFCKRYRLAGGDEYNGLTNLFAEFPISKMTSLDGFLLRLTKNVLFL